MRMHQDSDVLTYPDGMRTTVTLDADVAGLLDREMRECGVSFKTAINEAVRRGFGQRVPPAPVSTPVHDLGEMLLDVTHANRLADELTDAEHLARLRRGR